MVAPGFIDLLSYEPNDFGTWYKIGDGITTNLGMHGLNATARRRSSPSTAPSANRPPVHYGGAFDDPWMRTHDRIGTRRGLASAGVRAVGSQVESGFADGWLGVDFEPEYTPWVTDTEITALATVAAKHQMPVFFHVRYSSPNEPGKNNATALAEVLQIAEATGASVHVDHITSTGGTHTMPQSIETLEKARAKGVDVTACMYPYTFWATYAASSRFGYGWQQRYEISYGDLQIPGTDQRLTEATFAQAQRRERAGGRLRHPRGRRRHRPADRLDHDGQRLHPRPARRRATARQPSPRRRLHDPGARPLRPRHARCSR